MIGLLIDMKSEVTVTITHKRGMHLSPASIFAEKANAFKSDILVWAKNKADEKWDGKRVIDLVSIGAVHNTTLVIAAQGDDAEEAVSELVALVKDDFGLKT